NKAFLLLASGFAQVRIKLSTVITGSATVTVAASQLAYDVPLQLSSAGRLVVDASAVAVPVTDNSGSITVDAPVGTPVAARLSDGSSFVTVTSSRLVVDGSGVNQPVIGTAASDAA